MIGQLHALPSAARTGLRRLGEAALAIVYPPLCPGCGTATAEAHALCARCWADLRLIERPFCERLGTPFPVDLGMPLVSPAALADPPVYARGRAAVRYDDIARALVHRLKYTDRLDIARVLGTLTARAAGELAPDCDAIVPVPLHRLRLWRRRYNQAALLAHEVGRAHARPVEAFWLARVKRTTTQVGLSRAQRAENLQGAFRVPDGAKPRLRGKRVLLVDDVVTTGATANAAARALLRGGAAAVDLVSFARVVAES